MAIKLLKDGEYGVSSFVGIKGAYAVPINYVWDGCHSIYYHCAPEGEKLECIKTNPNVSFTIIGHTQVLSKQFSTEYESIVIQGVIERVSSYIERMRALELILDKYAPNDKMVGMQYAQKSFDRTVILRLDIQSMSGKTKRAIALSK